MGRLKRERQKPILPRGPPLLGFFFSFFFFFFLSGK